MISTTLFRLLLTLPAHITQQKVMAKRVIMSEEMKSEILPSLQRATNMHVAKNKWSKEKATLQYRRVAAHFHQLKVREHNCHAAKLFLPMYVQIPFWIFTSVGIRNMAILRHSQMRMEVSPVEERFLQMCSEGLWWCPNLTQPDPTLLLPIIVGISFAGAIFISNNKLQTQTIVTGEQKISKLNIFLFGVAALMVPVASYQPGRSE